MATIRSKLRYFCNYSKVNVFNSYTSVYQGAKHYQDENKTATSNAHRILRPFWKRLPDLKLYDRFGNKYNKMNGMKILRKHEPKKRRVNFPLKLFNLILKALKNSVNQTTSNIKSQNNFFPNQKSITAGQTWVKQKELQTFLKNVNMVTLNELPLIEQETKTSKYSHFRPIFKAGLVKRKYKYSTPTNKKTLLHCIKKHITMSSVQPNFLKPIMKNEKNIKANNVAGMLKFINLNKILCSNTNAESLVTFYEPKRHYHRKINNYTDNNMKLVDNINESNTKITNKLVKEKEDIIKKDKKTNEMNAFEVNKEVAKDIFTVRNNEIVKDIIQYSKKIPDAPVARNILNSKTNNIYLTDRSCDIIVSDFNMNKKLAKVAMTQNFGTTIGKESRGDYVNYINNFIKNNSIVLKRNYVKTKVNRNVNQPASQCDLNADLVAKLKKFNSYDDTQKVSKFTESQKMKLQKEDCTKSKQQIKSSSNTMGNTIRQLGVNTNEGKIPKHQHIKKIVPSETDAKSKYTTCEPYAEEKSLESYGHKKKVEKISQISTDVEKEVKSDATVDGVKNTIEGKKCFEESKGTANTTTVVKAETAKCTEPELKIPEKSTKNNSKANIESEEKKIDTDKLVYKSLADKETAIKQHNAACKMEQNSNNYLNKRIEENKNINKTPKKYVNKKIKFIEKVKEDSKKKEKTNIVVKNKGLESKINVSNKNSNSSSLKLNSFIFDRESTLSQNLSEIFENNMARNNSQERSKTAKVLSCLCEGVRDKPTSIFMRYKNAVKMAYERRNKGSSLYMMKGKQKIDNKVGFVYKRQASNKINLIDIEDKKRKLHKINGNLLHIKLARELMNKHKGPSTMNIHHKVEGKPRNSEMAQIQKQICDTQSNLRHKQTPKKVNARNVSILSAAVKNQKHSTAKEYTAVSVKDKLGYSIANHLNHSNEFGTVRNKISIKPKLLGYVNPKREVMTKERKNSLERFKIFYNRITQENIRQYDVQVDKLKFEARPRVIPLIERLNSKK